MASDCPNCSKGRFYERKDDDGYTERICYVCGYYWDDTEGYSELDKSMFRKYFPTESGWKKSPTVGQPFTSPEHWTEPEVEQEVP